jgi:hypothetical protein
MPTAEGGALYPAVRETNTSVCQFGNDTSASRFADSYCGEGALQSVEEQIEPNSNSSA